MAVHARYWQPCPDSRSKVQRIVHSNDETNCCVRCQSGGKLLADRALPKLRHASRPKHLDDLQ